VRTPAFALENDAYYLTMFEREAQDMVALVTSKRKDYGSSMGFHGPKGIVPRIADKFFRLDNLVWSDGKPKFESAIDTCRDLAVYALSLAVALQYEADNVGEANIKRPTASVPDSGSPAPLSESC